MEKPVIAGKVPIKADLKKGVKVAWCACGKSSNQPFCDGSHAGSSFNPIVVSPDNDKTVYFCVCKQSKNKPFCDGTHNSL